MSRSHSHRAQGPQLGAAHHHSLQHTRSPRNSDHPAHTSRTARHSPSHPQLQSAIHHHRHHHRHHHHHHHQKQHMSVPAPSAPGVVAPSDRPVGAYTTAGRPTYQHDRYLIHHARDVSLYAVADGHGSPDHGHLTSQHVVDTLPATFNRAGLLTIPLPSNLQTAANQQLADLDKAAIHATGARRVYAGSTMCAVLQVGHAVHCINVGDSRAILVSLSAARRATALSRDHICTDPIERRRIERAGGVVVGGLLNGYISMSRAFGDDDLKTHRDITAYPISGRKPYGADMFISEADALSAQVTDDDVAVVIASDGVWGKLSNDLVANIVLQEISRGAEPEGIARAISKRALSRGSSDNITTVVAFTSDLETVRRRVSQSSGSRRRFRVSLLPDSGKDSESDANPNNSSASTTTTAANESSSTLDSTSADGSSDRPGRRLRFGRRERTQLAENGGGNGRRQGRGEEKFAIRLWSHHS